jgi:hypothetical protein
MYWIVHRCVRNDDNKDVKHFHFGTREKDTSLDVMINIIKDNVDVDLTRIETKGDDETLLDRIRDDKYEWKRKGNYDLFYMIEGTTSNFSDKWKIGDFEKYDSDDD